MNSIMNKIEETSKNIIIDNNFLFTAFQNRLIIRLVHIFEKYKIPMNKNIISKNMEENLINVLIDINVETIHRYISLLTKYESLIYNYVSNHTDTVVIKRATMAFIQRISYKNSHSVDYTIVNNFVEYIKSIIFVYDNDELNKEVLNRINTDTKEISDEFNRNNYNFVIESINQIIKNIITKI